MKEIYHIELSRSKSRDCLALTKTPSTEPIFEGVRPSWRVQTARLTSCAVQMHAHFPRWRGKGKMQNANEVVIQKTWKKHQVRKRLQPKLSEHNLNAVQCA